MLGRVALFLLMCWSAVLSKELVRDPMEPTFTISGTKGSPTALTLKCILPGAAKAELEKIRWFRSSKGFADVELNKAYVRVDVNTTSSILEVPENEARDGVTKCKYRDEMEGWIVYPHFKMEHLPSSMTVIEHDDIKIKCRVRANAEKNGTVSWTWRKLPENEFNKHDFKERGETIDTWKWVELNNTDRSKGGPEHIRIVSGNNFSTLKIEDVTKSDRCYYRCYASLKLPSEPKPVLTSEHTLVRVKDKYSVLYPFIGIIVELIVLTLIVVLCERRKAVEEDEEDVEPEVAEAPDNGNSDLRHRKP